jgi:hypothetical protein
VHASIIIYYLTRLSTAITPQNHNRHEGKD